MFWPFMGSSLHLSGRQRLSGGKAELEPPLPARRRRDPDEPLPFKAPLGSPVVSMDVGEVLEQKNCAKRP